MQFSIKRWNLDSVEVVKRVIATVHRCNHVAHRIALIVLPGPAFVVIPGGLAILAIEYA